MKHLRRYNESIVTDVKRECDDILLELNDIGIKSSVNINNWGNVVTSDCPHLHWVAIQLWGNKFFQFKDIEEVVYRLCDYLGTHGLFIQHEIKKTIMHQYIHNFNFNIDGISHICDEYSYQLRFTECKELSD